MPLHLKSVIIVDEITRPQIGVRYVWYDLGKGIVFIASRVLGVGQGAQIKQAIRESTGEVKYRYDAGRIQDHVIQPRIRSLFRPQAWLYSGLWGLVTGGIYLAYRAVIGFAPAGQWIPEDILESCLIGTMFFVLSLGVRLWLSVRSDITDQVIQERGDVTETDCVMSIPLTEWFSFVANNEAVTCNK